MRPDCLNGLPFVRKFIHLENIDSTNLFGRSLEDIPESGITVIQQTARVPGVEGLETPFLIAFRRSLGQYHYTDFRPEQTLSVQQDNFTCHTRFHPETIPGFSIGIIGERYLLGRGKSAEFYWKIICFILNSW